MKTYLFLLPVFLVGSFKVGLDLNTFTAQELDSIAGIPGIPGEFTWAITLNSPGVGNEVWRNAFKHAQINHIISEDNPMGFDECKKIPSISGTPLMGAFGYHEVHNPGGTVLSWSEIDLYYKKCKRPIVLLTRAYWIGSEWYNAVQAVLRHPAVLGVAMEFNPTDVGLRAEKEFVDDLLAAGKHPIFLWPIRFADFTTESQIHNQFDWFCRQGANLYDDRVMFSIARYDKPYIPVRGAHNSVESAWQIARAWQGRFRQSHC